MTSNTDTLFQTNLAEHLQLFQQLSSLTPEVNDAGRRIASALAQGGKLMLCGNGGSAADAQHIASELTGRFIQERLPLAGIALTTDSSALTCIGNEAMVTSGLAKGAKGIVTGEHARLLVDFAPDIAEKLNIGDQIQIRTVGRGIGIAEFPQIEFKKTSPALLNALRLTRSGNGAVKVPVAMELPIEIMGSGAELNAEYVDQDLMSGDRALMADLGIDKMRLGYLIAIRHGDHHFGRSYRKGAISIALCIHGDSVMTGHGPGILTLMTCSEGGIEYEIDPTANIANYFSIGER